MDGIRIEKDQGSPNTQIHYTLFQGNTGLDLINNAGSNNQYVYAQMNYWGCDQAPSCCITRSRMVGGDWNPGDYYVDWMSKTEIADDTPEFESGAYEDCAILYGNDGGDRSAAELVGFPDQYGRLLPLQDHH